MNTKKYIFFKIILVHNELNFLNPLLLINFATDNGRKCEKR